MTSSKLGDSFDIVKRFFRDTLSEIAPLQCDPYFLEPGLQPSDYENATGVPVRSAHGSAIGLLLDPHTGIHVSDRHRKSRAYATTHYIAAALHDHSVSYCVVFDQSSHRNKVPLRDQLLPKVDDLRRRDIGGFYYVSHAPFLFAARRQDTLRALRSALREAGIPANRFFSNSMKSPNPDPANGYPPRDHVFQ